MDAKNTIRRVNTPKVVLVNAGVTYVQMCLAVILSLFSGRWVLNGLGIVDYGLFAVVGSVIGFLGFIKNALAGGAQRHMAYAIGQGDAQEVERVFNAGVSVHLMLAVLVCVLAETVGVFFLWEAMNIPPARMSACMIVFQCTIISAMASIVSVPFVAMFIARQRIAELSGLNTIQTVCQFGLAYSLLFCRWDRLIYYAVGCKILTVAFVVIQCARARWLFPACRIRREFLVDKERVRSLTSFSGWQLFGTMGGVGRNQGLAILLNLGFGPAMNCAYGIANQVSSQMSNVTYAVLNAISPEITSREGRGERQSMLDLSLRTSKYAVFLALLVCIPLGFEMSYILKVWLKKVPPYSVEFCRLMLAVFVVDKISFGYMAGINAIGRIKWYQVFMGGLLLLTMPIAYVAMKVTHQPAAVLYASLATATLLGVGRVFWMRHLAEVPVIFWTKEVLGRTLLVFSIPVLVAWMLHAGLAPSFLRLATVTVLCSVSAVSLFFVLGLDKKEQSFVRGGAARLWARLFGS